MKNQYVKPEMQVEMYEANQYVAACGKTPDGIYHFKCDAPGGYLYYYKNSYSKNGTYIGYYHPCGEKHDTKNKNNFYEGFIDYNKNNKEDDGEHVLVWRGDYGNNGHATTSLEMGEIDVERS